MRRQRKKYERPPKPFDKRRIEEEKELMKKYGLRRKKELWRAEALLRKFRRLARQLASKRDEKKEKDLIEKLNKLGILTNFKSLDDILGLTVEDILNRRLQTVIFNKGLVNTIKQARQVITHGHVLIENRKVVFPSYLVKKDEEDKIQIKIPIKLKVK